VDSTLLPGETVVYRTGLHWKVFGGPAVLGLLWIVTLFTGPTWLKWLAFALTAATAGWSYLRYIATEFAVTNMRVIAKVGWLQRRSLEQLLTKIEGISIDQSLTGRLFGYGTVVVIGTGGTTEPFDNIAQPLELRRRVQSQSITAQQQPLPATAAGARPAENRAERDCPYCAERILAKARVCKHCGRDVEPVA
jgi:uncharacterized membrane protein YdbT with pleckstrin-like domain